MMSTKTLSFAYWAAGYTAAGLLAGLGYREMTRHADFDGFTQLAVMHTHLLVLGTAMMLLFMIIEAVFRLSEQKFFTPFFWVYQAGVIITSSMMGIIGYRQLQGLEHSKALAGISGTGHILMTVAFILFFLCLFRAIKARTADTHGVAEPVRAS
ncbi:hypothetical protein BSZ39_09715 [Bowdeniella nasicola]|uniref:DUF2871 domain-containing protein n=1 Tax=Bowdeniella nasicola TaxID=208480 RepID=A0A1Q5Q0U9_9ACTO|nr:DUF2871 domain-containing protein [Bowdeniella nasicola]OKL53386.1 hypothetical protein BSZ39_09715 [Bowdeniella nasicola]